MLIVLACQMDMHGNYIAKELVQDQTLDNLFAFGERLAELDDRFGITS